MERLQKRTADLRQHVAEKLTCGDIILSPSEVSIRFLDVACGEMIANVEMEIAAHAFPERTKKQDEICLDIMKYVQEKTGIQDIKVWLKLSELGHSW